MRKKCIYIYGPQRMIPIIFVGRLTYHLAPAAGKSTCLFSEMSQN